MITKLTLKKFNFNTIVLHTLIKLFYFYLFIGFNITVINYQFVALLHWNSHITMGIQKIFLRQYFFTFLSIIFHIINFTLFAIFCHFGSFIFIHILTFYLLIFYKLSSYTSNIPIIVPCLSCLTQLISLSNFFNSTSATFLNLFFATFFNISVNFINFSVIS